MNTFFLRGIISCNLLLIPLLCVPGTTTAATHYGSLVVGITGEKVYATSVGGVQLINGSPSGLTPQGSTIFSQGERGLLGEAKSGDYFGASVATGDFNNDGFPDLAVGVPNKKVSIYPGAGEVHIIYGSSHGLASANNKIIRQGRDGIVGHPMGDERFGSSLAAGDFNGDGFSDLAVAADQENVGLEEMAGKLYIIYGSRIGLRSFNNRSIQQGADHFVEVANEGDHFGRALATGDFNNDGFWDLVVGVEGEKINGHSQAGAVHVIYGSRNGLTSAGNRVWSQDSPSILGQAGQGYFFGCALTSGDFNNDGFSDIVVGANGEHVDVQAGAGAINILYGSANGITAEGNQHFNQQTVGIYPDTVALNWFGTSLASGDFNNDSFSDVVVGVPGQNLVGKEDVGAVIVIYGSDNGLTTINSGAFHQKIHGIIGIIDEYDRFGESVATGDFNMDGFSDLAVGVPFDDLNNKHETGAVNIFYGSDVGLTNDGELYIIQSSYGMTGVSEPRDYFGDSLVFLPSYKTFSWPIFLPAINTGNGVSPP